MGHRESGAGHLVSCVLAAGLGITSVLLAGATPSPDSAQPLPARIDFNRDILPVLSDNCFQCHGPDRTTRMAGLRLDVPEVAFADRGGHAAIVPRNADRSELVRRITAPDPGERMPPEKTGKTLTPRQVALLKQWIAEGAAYELHWAFVPPRHAAPPETGNPAWPRNPIDRFVLERLAREGLAPSPEADRTTLIRRVTLDLTGLPPTVAEIDAFLADASPMAYERLVDRLLASPRYGERMALDWLDAARFADTHGYHIDAGRDMTRWRDWVIGAFNRNLPYDRFTVEQLAGDLLPDATLEQKIASGFNRNHMINFEGGAIAEEYQTAYVIDRVNTTGTVWLGLTVGCAQCHNHKFDPITQKEYYQLYALFNQIPEKGLDGRAGNAVPKLEFPKPEQERERARLTAEIKEAETDLDAGMPDVDPGQERWETLLRASRSEPEWRPLEPAKLESAHGTRLVRNPDQSILAGGPNPETECYTITAPVPRLPVTALRLEVLPDESFASRGPGRGEAGKFVLTRIEVEYGAPGAPGRRWPIRTATADACQPGFPAAGAIDASTDSGWDSRTGERHFAVFAGAAPIESPAPIELRVRLEFTSKLPRHNLGRFRLSVTESPTPHTSEGLGSTLHRILVTDAAQRNEPDRSSLRRYYRESVAPETAERARRLADLRASLAEGDARVPTTMVMQELAKPRDTFILVRGQYDRPGEKVAPGVPAFLPPLAPGAPPNRLGLARWLVDPAHPLTARVAVNRYWQMYFGTGLVKTAEDFGAQGERPSHPELLDWLATEFVASGWDVKALQRIIVTSATYRQASTGTPELVARDPENRLLARGARHRLAAEFIRDSALAVSGLLNPEIGGRSVLPYQPAGLWEELADKRVKYSAQVYVQGTGADLYRRSMYTFWKRTSPPPSLSTLDAPNRETCTVRRPRTNTPLQALVLMNDPTYVEAARKLAERMLLEGGASTDDRIAFGFRLATGRRPAERERDVLRRLLGKQRALYGADAPLARQLLEVGESARRDGIAEPELAAWTIVATTILNLDETLTKG